MQDTTHSSDDATGLPPIVIGGYIDTLAITKRLKSYGYSESQAEGQATIFSELSTTHLATQKGLEELRLRLEGNIEQVRAELVKDLKLIEERIERVKSETTTTILKWMIPLFLGTYALLAGLILRLGM